MLFNLRVSEGRDQGTIQSWWFFLQISRNFFLKSFKILYHEIFSFAFHKAKCVVMSMNYVINLWRNVIPFQTAKKVYKQNLIQVYWIKTNQKRKYRKPHSHNYLISSGNWSVTSNSIFPSIHSRKKGKIKRECRKIMK